MSRTRATATLCPRAQHPYPDARWHRVINGRPHYYCRGCRYDYDKNGAYGADEVNVQRAVEGNPPPYLHPEERRRVVLELSGRKRNKPTLAEIARRARCHPRTVQRIRAAGRGDKW